MLLNLDDEDEATPEIKEIHPPRPSQIAYAIKAPVDYTWQDVRDRAVREIYDHSGPFERNPVIEASIFRNFYKRHGAVDSVRILTWLFDVCGGVWYGNYVHVNNFCKAADPTFANEILRVIESEEYAPPPS